MILDHPEKRLAAMAADPRIAAGAIWALAMKLAAMVVAAELGMGSGWAVEGFSRCQRGMGMARMVISS
jgi:hypothetical protein